jgi:hypothetical protein
MKARIKATGEIIDVSRLVDKYIMTNHPHSITFDADELDFEFEPDYWEKLKHQYAGMAMQAMISNSHNTDYHKDWSDGYGKWRKYNNKELAEMAVYYATALVEKLKEELQCEK